MIKTLKARIIGYLAPDASAASANDRSAYMTLASCLLTNRPYFGPAFASAQGTPERHRYFASCVAALTPTDVTILEVGSWAGSSAITWAMALRRNQKLGKVVCLDQWQPYFDEAVDQGEPYKSMNDAARSEAVFNLFLHNIRTSGFGDDIDWVRGSSKGEMAKMAPSSVDLIFLDGDHRYKFIAEDIVEAKRIVRIGGIICGDDLDLQRSDVDANQHLRNVASNRDTALDPRTQRHYHPGVAEAVHEHFGTVSNACGFWAIQSAPEGWLPVNLVADDDVPSHLQDISVLRPD